MAVETFGHIDSLNTANPTSSDPKSEGDDHLRGIKTALKNSFPNVTGAVTATQVELNLLDGVTAATAELNILDGVTATTAELNILDGVTATTAELNYVDGVTSDIQTQIDTKQSATAEVSTPHVTLDAIAKTISTTADAQDIFIYDTSKDSDGGAWRKRTQHTSWYNEASSTTRSSRKEFPAVAVIVAIGADVKIYDGDTPDLDMWMVFTGSASNMLPRAASALSLRNGILSIGTNDGFHSLNFIEDTGYWTTATTTWGGYYKSVIKDRNNTSAHTYLGTGSSLPTIVNSVVNDIAMTILPNAPVDSATGLPIPTIAIATDGGVSVIKDDGTVVDLICSNASYTISGLVSFREDNAIVMGLDNGQTPRYIFVLHDIPTADLTVTSNVQQKQNADEYYSGNPALGELNLSPTEKSMVATTSNVFGSSFGLASIKENTTTPSKGSVAYITSDYNTGYMTGDIRGAWNVDTDVTALSGTELVTNGTFDSDLTGWTIDNASAQTVEWSSGVVRFVTTGAYVAVSQTIPVVSGKPYVVGIDLNVVSGAVGLSLVLDGVQVNYLTSGAISRTFTPTGSTLSVIAKRSGAGEFTIDNISIKEAIPDRSVKGNGLAVHGSPTVSAVASGAELKAISGFSSTNYLEQPYNSDLDFGTGDFSVMGWAFGGGTANLMFIERGTSSLSLYLTAGQLAFACGVSPSLTDGKQYHQAFHLFTLVRRSGVAYVYVDGVLIHSAARVNTVNDTGSLFIGVKTDGSNPATTSELALWRVSATAPTAEQIKEIYEAEKPMFQANAKCTLNGSSDAVTALAFDASTELLHVGTSGGRSTFQGLRRVDETSTSTSEIAAQGGLIVEET